MIQRHLARPTGRTAVGLAVVAIAAALVIPTMWRAAGTDVEASGEAGSLLTLVNQSRADAGLPPLAYASDLTAVASERAAIMARTGALTHTSDLGGRVCCWTWVGENVAYAGSVQALHDVLMNSAPHRANILSADADDVGIAVVRGNGSLWAAEVFRARSDADRSDAAGSPSRNGDRTNPTGSGFGTSTGTSTGTGTAAPTTPTLTPAELAAQRLRQHLADARDRLQDAKRKHGPFDPVRAAMRYQETLDAVSD